jgi:uncharacterized membrane protein YphA (DoxX/SURF4 family)
MSVKDQAARGCSAWPKDVLRVTFGVIWAIDATLKWLPGFRDSYMSTIMGIRDGQPGWLRWWFDFWINLQHPAITFFWALVAASETLIAVALITGFARKTTYTPAAVFSVLIWATAEGFGGPYTSGASDIGTAVIYAVVFAGLLALSYYTGPSRYTADYYLERRYSWWWWLADLRRRRPAQERVGATGGDGRVRSPPCALPLRTARGTTARSGKTSIRTERTVVPRYPYGCCRQGYSMRSAVLAWPILLTSQRGIPGVITDRWRWDGQGKQGETRPAGPHRAGAV